MSSEAQVLLMPARTPEIEGRSLYYLFSVRQVAEVLLNTTIHRAPSAPPYVQGVAGWCGRMLPVLSLERCLGLEILADRMPLRDVVVRSVTQNNGGRWEEHYAICRVGVAIKYMTLPLHYEPGKVPDRITDASCLTAVFYTQASLLLVVNVEKIINTSRQKQSIPLRKAVKGKGAISQTKPLHCVGGGEPHGGLVQG
jgi:chemotaxis signal transduction protein